MTEETTTTDVDIEADMAELPNDELLDVACNESVVSFERIAARDEIRKRWLRIDAALEDTHIALLDAVSMIGSVKLLNLLTAESASKRLREMTKEVLGLRLMRAKALGPEGAGA